MIEPQRKSEQMNVEGTYKFLLPVFVGEYDGMDDIGLIEGCVDGCLVGEPVMNRAKKIYSFKKNNFWSYFPY